MRRVIYPVGIIFKGSGFYVTDHPRPLAQVVPGRAGEPGPWPKSYQDGLASTGPGHRGRRPAPTSERDKEPSYESIPVGKEESKESERSKEEGSEG